LLADSIQDAVVTLCALNLSALTTIAVKAISNGKLAVNFVRCMKIKELVDSDRGKG
jgi:hypothetical protein